MRRWIGPLLMGTGVLDVLYVLVLHYRQLSAVAADGFFNAVEPDVALSTLDRETAFWHLTFGTMVVLLGGLVHWAQERTGTLPAFLGWSLLAISAAALILIPLSGFWLVLPQAVMAVLVARRNRPGIVAEAGSATRT